jgi:hypothetical protein
MDEVERQQRTYNRYAIIKEVLAARIASRDGRGISPLTVSDGNHKNSHLDQNPCRWHDRRKFGWLVHSKKLKPAQ